MSMIRHFKQGSMFGERAIKDPNCVRRESYRATQDCVLLAMATKDHERYLKAIMDKIEDERIEFFKSTIMFKSWTKASCRSFMSFVTQTNYRKGQSIIS